MGPTVALTFLLFTIMLNDCNSMVVTADSLSSLQPLLEGAKCIHGSSRVTALCRQLNYQCEVSYTACKVDFIDYCNEGSALYNYYQTQADPRPTYAPFQANAEMCPDADWVHYRRPKGAHGPNDQGDHRGKGHRQGDCGRGRRKRLTKKAGKDMKQRSSLSRLFALQAASLGSNTAMAGS